MTGHDESVYRAEIEGLHEWFVQWYVGTLEPDAFERVEAALAPGFERVSPEGDVADRETVLAGIEDTYDAYEPGSFDIDIRDVRCIEERPERALVRYEEWQETPEGTSGRISTVLFAPHRAGSDGEPPIAWRYLQETWLEA